MTLETRQAFQKATCGNLPWNISDQNPKPRDGGPCCQGRHNLPRNIHINMNLYKHNIYMCVIHWFFSATCDYCHPLINNPWFTWGLSRAPAVTMASIGTPQGVYRWLHRCSQLSHLVSSLPSTPARDWEFCMEDARSQIFLSWNTYPSSGNLI